jgi:23S rRNA pseudouridine1911/1915/1917 synthase
MPWNRAIEILQDTPDWIAVAKPAGLATIPGRGENDSVLQAVAGQLDLPASGTADPRLRVVHRLDKETSGVLLFAKHTAAQRHFSHQFQNNTVEKEYLALVAGEPGEPEGEIDAPLARHPADPKRMAVVKHGGRPARTLWRIEQRFRGLTLLRVFPKTGKTHQIRVHLKHIGLPLAIDPLYHPHRSKHPPGLFLSTFKRDYRPTRGEEERPLIARLTLHAHRLTVTDMSGERVTLECRPPKDFRATLTQLARHAAR